MIKPAEDTPLSALAVLALAEQAGIPKGVLNIVTCQHANAGEVGKVMCESPKVGKSTDVSTFQKGGTKNKFIILGSRPVLHRIHPRGQDPVPPVRRDREKDLPGARRQRALHRLRLGRPRPRGQGLHGLQVPQRRPDLRLHQPRLRPGRRVRRVRRQAQGGRLNPDHPR